MSGPEDRALLAARLLGAASSSEVSHRLVSEASKWRLGADEVVQLPGELPVELFESLSSLPAPWAERVVASVDPSTELGTRCAALAAADGRAGVRRALAKLPGLPLEVLEVLVPSAVGAGDDECLADVLKWQSAPPASWARWLVGPDGLEDRFGITALRSKLLEIGGDVDALEFYLTHSERPSFVAAALLPSASGGGRHLVDWVPHVVARGDESLGQLLDELQRHPARCDARTVSWLQSLGGVSLVKGSLCHLVDPVEIRRWWNSGLDGAHLALFDDTHLSSAAIVETVAELIRGEARARIDAWRGPTSEPSDLAGAPAEPLVVASWVSNKVSALLAGVTFVHNSVRDAVSAGDVLTVIDEVLSLCEEFPSPGSTVEVVQLPKLFRVVHGVAPEAEVAPLLCRLARVAPHKAGMLALLLEDPPAELADAVAADPARFGVSASAVTSLAMGGSLLSSTLSSAPHPAGLWAAQPERFCELLAVLPGLLGELARDTLSVNAAGLSRVAGPVAAFVESRLGAGGVAWDSFLAMGPTFAGSVAELVEVCSTFTD